MSTVKTMVIRTAGRNCDEETLFAFEQCGSKGDLVHVNNLIAGGHQLADYQILAIPGGFTYGDDVASGKVFAIELINALGDMIQAFVDNTNYMVICIQLTVAKQNFFFHSFAFGDFGNYSKDSVFTLKINEPCHKYCFNSAPIFC